MKEDKIRILLQKVYIGEKKICIFGAGRLGKSDGIAICKTLNLTIDCFCDNNNELWGKKIKEEISCIALPELLKKKIDYVVLVITSKDVSRVIKEDLETQGIEEIATYSELLKSKYVIERILNIHINNVIAKREAAIMPLMDQYDTNAKIAIYSCITGDYDKIYEPSIKAPQCDYYIISDRKYSGLKTYQWVDIKSCVPKGILDIKDQNRYCKMHGDVIFPKYKYSIYLDGNITIQSDISSYIQYIGKTGLAMFLHEERNCIYAEGATLALREMVNIQELKIQLQKYADEGMPINFGLFAAGIIVRDHSNRRGKYIMKEWFKEYLSGVKRDQIALMYVLWKNGYVANDIGYILDGMNRFQNQNLIWHNHKRV